MQLTHQEKIDRALVENNVLKGEMHYLRIQEYLDEIRKENRTLHETIEKYDLLLAQAKVRLNDNISHIVQVNKNIIINSDARK